MSMTMSACDASFFALERDVGILLDNLGELSNLSLYSQLEDPLFMSSLMDTSKSKAKQIKEFSDRLSLDSGLLVEQLAAFKKLRATSGPFNANKLSTELERLLTGQTIVRETVEIPIEQRSLLSSRQRERLVSPRELMALMENLFSSVKSELIKAEKDSDRIAQQVIDYRSDIAKLRQRLQAIGKVSTPAIDVFETAVLRLLLRCTKDIFNLPATTGNIVDTPMEMAKRSVETLEKSLQVLDSNLDAAASLGYELNRLRVNYLRSARTLQVQLSEADVPSTKDLWDSLEAIRELAKSDKFQAQEKLSDWTEKANARQHLLRSQKFLLDERVAQTDSLRSRWQAASQRAQTGGFSDDGALNRFREKIESAFESQDLGSAQPWLSNYEIRLSGLLEGQKK